VVAPRPLCLALLVLGCDGKPDSTVALPADNPASSSRRDEPPVPLNADAPVQYPEALALQRLGGTVILRLFVDSAGRVVPESTSVRESSGYPAFDSAAKTAAPRLRYAPALRNGMPVAAPFLQPVRFRIPTAPSPPSEP
jgi:TonB family protein